MSFMRWPVYVWNDGYTIHLWLRGDLRDSEGCYPLDLDAFASEFIAGLAMPLDLFDQLVLARYAQLTDSRIRRIVRKLRSRKSPVSSNFGSFDFLETIGKHPMDDFRKQMRDAASSGPGAL